MIIELLNALVKGIPVTLAVTCGSFALGFVCAIPVTSMRRSKSRIFRTAARVYIDVVRGIPPIVWLFIIFFGVGTQVIELGSMQAAILGMGIVSSAYIAEIYRGGLLALASGQVEAATALGMTPWAKFRHVVAPQVLRVSIPPLATYFVSLLKDTTVASTIGVNDILMLASQEAQGHGGGFAPFVLAAALYILLSAPIGIFSRRMDERLRLAEGAK